ncbi:MAG: serine/threonine-protein kinase [Ktedonobacteraceae bacterium]
MAELAGVLVGNYFLLECVAREGMVETYCTRPTTRGGVDVILRLFRPEFPDPTSFREHFAEEVEKVWRCHHDHIQPLLEFGTGDDLLYCATLAPEGETLAQLLERYPERYLPIPFAVRVITQLCSALQYAHERGIVHGNIQPSSILLDDEEHVLLTHFGMKRAYQEGEALVSQLREGNAAYVAPEQALGMIQEASDIYALGVLLFRLVGSFLPYDDEDRGEIAIQHANEPMPALRTIRADVSEELELVVRTALAKTPGDRFASPATLAQALQAALEPQSPQVVPSAPERRIAVRARRTHVSWSRISSFFMLLVLLTGLIGASFFIFSLPAHMYDLRTISFLNPGHAVATATKIATKARSTPTGATTTTGLTPISGSYPPISTTSTIAVSPTPTVNGTVSGTPATPPVTPAPLPLNCATGTLAIDGSQSLGPLLQQLGSDYQNHCPNFTLALNESGSRVGLNALQQRHIDVASSDLTARSSRNLVDHPIAALLYAIVVNPDVQISGLSSATLQAIYQGTITNWSQVGGPDETITVYQRPTTDTVTTIFRTFVLNGATEHVRGMRLKKDWVQAVAMTPGAISYVPLVEAEASNVAVLAIDGAQPGVESLQQGSYPFWSVEHLYTRGNGTSQFQAYLPFLNSTKEATMFAQFGALPVSMMTQDVLATHLPGPEI